ncbi:MAG: hypothetical protein ACRDSJ_07785 [Rubrobacteraceae bacterium]
MNKTSKTIEEMETERRALDRRIRAAKRAAAKAQSERVMSAQQDLGMWLCDAVGADTVEAVEALRAVLNSRQFREHLSTRLVARTPDAVTPAVDRLPSVSKDASSPDGDDHVRAK